MVFRNTIYIPNEKDHLIPPLIPQEAGVIVNKVPKILCDEATEENNSVWFKKVKDFVRTERDLFWIYNL